MQRSMKHPFLDMLASLCSRPAKARNLPAA